MLSDTTQLRAKMMEMEQRIRELEDALAILQSTISSEPHPLLRDELLTIKFPPDRGTPLDKEEFRDRTSDIIDALGILTVGDQGVRYYGPSAGTEALFMAGAEMDMSAVELDETPRVSAEITKLLQFPFAAQETSGHTLDGILNHLPPQPRAWSLYETYAEHASWIFGPVKRDEIIDEILSPIYKAIKEKQTSGSSTIELISPHKAAVLFFVFALGALVDLTVEPYNAESETYYHLGCACLSLRSVFDSPEIYTVQAVSLMAAAHTLGGKKHTLDSAWALMSLAVKLAQSIGLHRDGVRFNMDPKTVQRRRHLFWEIFSTELFFSLSLGRPPSIHLSYVDCEFPEDDQATLDENGNVRIGFYRWKYEFLKEILAQVAELTLTAKAPQYQAILELDRKVCQKVLPAHLNSFFESKQSSPSEYMRTCMLSHYRASILMYIHRSFFAQAMIDHPVNPLRSAYAPSFLAAYRCASGLIKSNLYHFQKFPDLCPRVWSIWTSLFPAAVIVGCIVTRSPASSIAPSAFIELTCVCELFEKGAVHSRRARDGLAILRKLKERADQIYSQFRTGDPTSNATLLAERGDDELSLFGGHTRVKVSKLLSNRSPKGGSAESASPSPSTQSSSDSDAGLSSAEQTPDVHPALMEYLSKIPLEYDNNNSNPFQPPDSGYQHDFAAFSVQQMEYSTQENQNMQFPWQLPVSSFATSISHPSYSSSQTSSFTDPFVPQSEFGTTESRNDVHGGNLFDLEMMITSASSMDEQWMSFMRDTGLLDANRIGSGCW